MPKPEQKPPGRPPSRNPPHDDNRSKPGPDGTGRHVLAEGFATLLRRLPWSMSVLGCVYFFTEAMKVYAGKVSSADMKFALDILANWSLSAKLSWGAAAGGIGYGLRQRALRRRTVAHMQSRNVADEKRLDPNRSSSELTLWGTTRDGD